MSGAQIKIVPGDFVQAHSDLLALEETLSECRNTLETACSTMAANWSGEAADAFEEQTTELFRNYREITRKLRNAAAYIKHAGDEMQKTDKGIAGLLK